MEQYRKMLWLNKPSCPDTAAISLFDGMVDDTEPYRSSYIKLTDCNTAVRIHRFDYNSMDEFIEVIKGMRNELDAFLSHLEETECEHKEDEIEVLGSRETETTPPHIVREFRSHVNHEGWWCELLELNVPECEKFEISFYNKNGLQEWFRFDITGEFQDDMKNMLDFHLMNDWLSEYIYEYICKNKNGNV